MPLTYSEYLKLHQLLDLQEPLSSGPDHDETLFIVIHQVYELWFKQVLHELDYLHKLLSGNRTDQALHTLDRLRHILKILVAQVDILETMTPLQFLSFRDRLESASGFQSYQFREVEFALGLKNPGVLSRFEKGTEPYVRLEKRYFRSTLWDAFLRYLSRNGYAVPEDLLSREFSEPAAPSPAVQKILTEIYRHDPQKADLCERLLDIDEGIQEWRYRHVKMVERTIGTKPGTGGSSGVEYLKSTLHQACFPDLWAIRAELKPEHDRR